MKQIILFQCIKCEFWQELELKNIKSVGVCGKITVCVPPQPFIVRADFGCIYGSKIKIEDVVNGVLKQQDFISDYVDGYELRGDNGDYIPTAQERYLIEDAIRGIIEETEWIKFFANNPDYDGG